MPYYTKVDDEVDDCDEYDATLYTGGYDITVTYGRSIPPSDETCYPLSSRSGDAFEYQRPMFSSIHEPSYFGDQALKTEYNSNARPGGGHGEGYYGGRKPGYVGSALGGPDFGPKSESEHGSSYGHVSKEDGDFRKTSHGHRKDYDDDENNDKRKSHEHKKHSGKDSDDENSKKKEKKKYRKKNDKNSDDDEKKKRMDYHYGDYDEKKKHKDHYDGDDDYKKKKKDYYKGHKDHDGDDYDKKKKKDHGYNDDGENKKKKDHYKHHD